jgi:hypothetical protein
MGVGRTVEVGSSARSRLQVRRWMRNCHGVDRIVDVGSRVIRAGCR